jgi:hypothetical protein
MTVLLTSEGVEKPVDMTSNVNKKFTIVKHFERELKGYFVVFNLITVSDPNIKNAMQDELLNGKGDAIINVKIKGQTTFLDGCLSVGVGILGGLALPPYGVYLGDLIGARTYTIEGDVIRYID